MVAFLFMYRAAVLLSSPVASSRILRDTSGNSILQFWETLYIYVYVDLPEMQT